MKILNYGSMNIDHVYAVAHSVVPGETIIADSMALFCGGKGLNQSVAVAKAGGEIYHAGMIGDDGDMLVRQLEQAGVHTCHVARRPGASCHTVIQVDPSGQNSIIVYNTPELRFAEAEIDAILEDFQAGDLLMLQNELYGSDQMMAKAAQKGLTVIFNPSPMDSHIGSYPLERVDWLILNEIEGAAMSGETEPEAMLAVLRRRFPKMNIMLTLGEQGSVCACGDGLLYQKAFPTQAVDTTAAGDTFTGYFVTGLAAGKPIQEIMKRASLAASIAVGRKGAADSIPTADEVDRAEQKL